MMEYISTPLTDYQSPYGFRLQPSRGSSKDSVASYKQRIDSMFDDSQSVGNGVSSILGDSRETFTTPSAIGDASKLIENDTKILIKNMVQARIEKMFADVEVDGEGKSQRSKLEPSTFSVDYLGSLPLMKKVSSLEGLQEPLKDLYLHYKQMGNVSPVFRDALEISNCGLRVKFLEEKEDEVIEQLNPFPTIAVWAAVKFICRPRGLDHGKEFGLEYAFVPLISDPERTDKRTLFRKLTPNEASYFTGDFYSDHSPLFVAVMRRMGASRQLECHGFVCSSNENAIVIAANLYKALVITMAKNQNSEENGKKRNLKHANGLSTVCSVGGTSIAGDFECLSIDKSVASPSDLHLPPHNMRHRFWSSPSNNAVVQKKSTPSKVPPPRPPRKVSANYNVQVHVKHPDPDEILQLPSSPSQSPQFIESNRLHFNSEYRNEKPPNSRQTPYVYDNQSLGTSAVLENPTSHKKFIGKHSSFCTKEYSDRGDILTKVAIPRSHSFLNANGPLSSRYNRHPSFCPLDGNNQRKHSVGSPLGLNELFNEFRLQEGLNNIEDILNAIIDSDGMSFNDLKPIYKEFLLKLAVTLTKDEMYQRSKTIMQRQKNRKKKISRKNSCKLKKTFSAGKGFRRAFRRSLLKLKFNRPRSSGFEFSSVLFPSCTRFRTKKPPHKTTTYLKSYGFPYNSSSDDSTLLPKHRRRSLQVQPKSNHNSIPITLNSTEPNPSIAPNLRLNCKDTDLPNPSGNNLSEDSDFFSLMMADKNRKATSQNKIKVHGTENCLHQASSGYFSCSDCSYDSESCTCTSADKCYCSMGKQGKVDKLVDVDEKNVSLTSCECDTDSCFESEKCYCDQKRKPSLFEQLKQQGFAASESSLSRANSPTSAWQKNEAQISEEKRKSHKKSKDAIQSSKSLEYLKIRPKLDGFNSAIQIPMESMHNSKFNNMYQSPVEVFENIPIPKHQIKKRQLKSSISSSPMTSSSEGKCNKSVSSQRRSSSSDNLALDYNMFSTNSKSDEDTPSEDRELQQRKVLVVSTRDPKGRVIYVSAKQRFNSSFQMFNKNRDIVDDAFSVKKTAEIAALFSGVSFNQRSSNSVCSAAEEVIYSTLEPPPPAHSGSSGYMKQISLENSLGYFP